MRFLVLAVVAAAGCGRISFDERAGDASSRSDGPMIDGLDSSLVLWLPFDTDTDDVITGGAATCLNSCPQRVPGRTGMAVQYLGGGECLQFAASAAIINAPTFTLALWVNKPADGEFSYFAKPFDPALTDFNSWQLEDHINQQLGFTTHNATRHDIMFTADAGPGAWHHLAASFDGATKRIYIDGTLRMSTPEPDAVQYDASPIVLGCDINNGNTVVYPYTGMFDDVRVYNRALADLEVATLAQ